MPVAAGFGALQQQINANHLQVMALLGQMQVQIGQMQVQIGQVQGQIAQIQDEQQLLPMRLYNASTSDTAPLRYPAGLPQGHPLPHTRRDLFELTGKSSLLVDVDVANIS
ncbi:hypothetical protein P167DRAFT_542526 [Morchella conica CCBAS932]|uniref:Uncharacterized protein n=1 Tax=Morchella conica CCBAS932 TaxID=1392247 RepID=A0A3N4LCT4_9PEZI|nr:hypothetical protein P167DRAFT_542526 [Morchella conica CCBAS932]